MHCDICVSLVLYASGHLFSRTVQFYSINYFQTLSLLLISKRSVPYSIRIIAIESGTRHLFLVRSLITFGTLVTFAILKIWSCKEKNAAWHLRIHFTQSFSNIAQIDRMTVCIMIVLGQSCFRYHERLGSETNNDLLCQNWYFFVRYLRLICWKRVYIKTSRSHCDTMMVTSVPTMTPRWSSLFLFVLMYVYLYFPCHFF